MELEADGQKFDFNLLGSHNPYGTGNAHRNIRVVLKSPMGLHPVCWLSRAKDGGVSFGFPKNFIAGYVGTGFINKTGELSRLSAENLEGIEAEKRTSPHVTLHPSGVCHLRTAIHKPLVEYKINGWYPVKKEFEFIHAHSDPLFKLPTVDAPRSRDAVIPFPNQMFSAYLKIDILPVDPGPKHHMKFQTTSIVSVGPDYAVRMSIYHHEPAGAQFLINTLVPYNESV